MGKLLVTLLTAAAVCSVLLVVLALLPIDSRAADGLGPRRCRVMAQVGNRSGVYDFWTPGVNLDPATQDLNIAITGLELNSGSGVLGSFTTMSSTIMQSQWTETNAVVSASTPYLNVTTMRWQSTGFDLVSPFSGTGTAIDFTAAGGFLAPVTATGAPCSQVQDP